MKKEGRYLSIRSVLRITGRITKNQILKFSRDRLPADLSEHELGRIGETITREVIVPQIKGIRNVQTLNLEGVSGVPFDMVAKYDDEVWLIETKTGKSRFEGVQATQKKRMKKILEFLAHKNVSTRPILVQIKLETGDYVVRDFETKYKARGFTPTFERIVESVLGYVGGG